MSVFPGGETEHFTEHIDKRKKILYECSHDKGGVRVKLKPGVIPLEHM